MAEDMVERVAVAILAAHDWTQNPVSNDDGLQVTPAITGWNALTPDWQECFRGMARAAIEAMREPPVELLEAMHAAMFSEPFDGTNLPMLGAGFDAVIDAALAPTPPRMTVRGAQRSV